MTIASHRTYKSGKKSLNECTPCLDINDDISDRVVGALHHAPHHVLVHRLCAHPRVLIVLREFLDDLAPVPSEDPANAVGNEELFGDTGGSTAAAAAARPRRTICSPSSAPVAVLAAVA